MTGDKIKKIKTYVEGTHGFLVEVDDEEEVTLVMCKDCKQSGIDSTSYPQYWCSAHAEYHDGDWFCADGERKDI